MAEKTKKILVCGATGFIGRNVIEYYSKLDKEYSIRATFNIKKPFYANYPNVDWIKCDLRKEDDVKKAMKGIDIVMHFAATTTGAKDIVSKPYIHVTDNVVMTSLLMREAFHQEVEHFIFPSCTIMYQKSEKALKENDFNPSDEIQSFYFGAGYTKVYLEKMCEFYSRLNEGKTKYTVMRHSNMYGPHDKYDLEKSHVTGATITKVMESKDNKISVWGTGEEKRDLLYIEDLVRFIDLSLKKQKNNYELFNVGLGEGIKIKDLVNKVIKHSGKVIEVEHDLSKPTVPTSLFLDCSKAEKLLGWKPKYTLDMGLIKTLQWYRGREVIELRAKVLDLEARLKEKNKNKDLAVIIQSRDRPDKLRETIDNLYSSCEARANFDIVIAIDDDQKELYKDIRKDYPELICIYSPHKHQDWTQLIKRQHKFILDNDYYFIWAICDDIFGIHDGWDKAIIKHKGKFADGLFTICDNTVVERGQMQAKSQDCVDIRNENYNVKDYNMTHNSEKLYHLACDRLPVYTKQWIKFMGTFLHEQKYAMMHELITASLVLLLDYLYGEDRMIKLDVNDGFHWEGLVNNQATDIRIDDVGTRGEVYMRLRDNDYEQLRPIVEKMHKEIVAKSKN